MITGHIPNLLWFYFSVLYHCGIFDWTEYFHVHILLQFFDILQKLIENIGTKLKLLSYKVVTEFYILQI